MTSLTFKDIVHNLLSIINLLIPVLAGIAIVFFFIGLIRFIYNAGDVKSRSTGRDAMVWGLVGIFVIFSLWGIIAIVQQSLFGSTTINSSGSSGSPASNLTPYSNPVNSNYPSGSSGSPASNSNPYSNPVNSNYPGSGSSPYSTTP